MASSDLDAATEVLIAQLMAEDLGESYQKHLTPIGASYHDYEEPLSSYERQCLDAENNLDDEDDEGSGWGPDYPDGRDHAAAHSEGLNPIEQAAEGTWNSRFVDENGQVQDLITPEQSSLDGDDHQSDLILPSNPSDENPKGPPARVVSLPTRSAPKDRAGEISNISALTTLPSQTSPAINPGAIPRPQNHLGPSNDSRHDSFIPSNPSGPNEQPPASAKLEIEDHWDDGLDYSSYKGKGKAVRAYDEFKRGLRNGERGRQGLNTTNPKHDRGKDTDRDSEEEREGRDEKLPFIHIPWPRAEPDELLSQREDSEVVEIRVGDDETLESILRDIALREERRKKGKDLESREDHVGQQERGEKIVPGRRDVAVCW